MPKLFCISDIHSFYDPMLDALSNAGYEPDNPDHWLVVLGDIFDRGPDSAQILGFLERTKNKILIKGNHEYLLEECCERKKAFPHDYHNGTVRTIADLGWYMAPIDTFEESCDITLKRVKPLIDSMVDYFETEHYIFVHGWIPVEREEWTRNNYHNLPDFRDATKKQWEDASWLCGPDMAIAGLNNTGKTIVFGHWHTSYLWSIAEDRSEFSLDARFDIFYGKDYIAIDACTAYSGKVNCLVIEDEFI